MPGYSEANNKYPITGRKGAEIYVLKDERNQMIKEGRPGDAVNVSAQDYGKWINQL